MLLCSFCNSDFDGVDDGERTVTVTNDLDGIIHTGDNDFRHLRSVIAVDRFYTAAPDEQTTLDGHIVQHNFTIRRAAADDEVTIHGQVFQFYIVGADQDAAFDVLAAGSFTVI